MFFQTLEKLAAGFPTIGRNGRQGRFAPHHGPLPGGEGGWRAIRYPIRVHLCAENRELEPLEPVL